MLGQDANIIGEGPEPHYARQKKDKDPSNNLIETLQTILPNILGPIGAAVLFYHLGARLVDNLLEKHNGEASVLKEAIAVFFAENNLGRVKIEDSRCISSLTISMKTLPLAEGGSIGCYFVRGVFQRYLKYVKGFDVEVEESQCVTKGSSVCEFMIKEVKRIEATGSDRRT